MATWRAARSLTVLAAEVDTAFTGRSKLSDGTLGDLAHSARASDHNPDSQGVVRAKDFTNWDPDGPIDVDFSDDVAEQLAEFLRHSRDPRVKYVIWRGRMFSSYASKGVAAWTWRKYDGPNGHFHHVHVSVVADARGDDTRPWGFRRNWQQTQQQEEDDLTPDQARMLAEVHGELFKRLDSRVGGTPVPADRDGVYRDTILGFSANAEGAAIRIERYIRSKEFRAALVDELLDRKLPTPTWRDGQVVTEDAPVKLILPRSAEASVTRHREEKK